MKSLLLFSTIALSLIFLAATAQPAEGGIIINNAGFETTTLSSPGGYICQASGNTTCTSNLTGWTSTCNAANGNCGTSGTVASVLFAGTGGSAFNGGFGLWTVSDSPDGGNYVAIDGDSVYSASISQSIGGLIVGDHYALVFDQAAAQQNSTTGPTTEQWQVTFGSQTQTSPLMNDTSHGFVAWNKVTLNFVATSATQTLTFLALGSPHGGPPVVLLDGLSMTETPEPQTYALVGLGLAAIPLIVKRRKTHSRVQDA
jgi:hypothetical protein